MIIIGLVLLIVAVVFGLDLLWKNDFPVQDPLVFGQSLGIHTARGFFLTGVITGAVLLLGIALILSGIRRKGRKIVQRRRDRKEAGAAQESRDPSVSEDAGRRQREERTAAPSAQPSGTGGEQPRTPASGESSRAGATSTEEPR